MASKDDVISHLRSILSNLHYPSKKCAMCGWVDSAEKWARCDGCSEFSCEDCDCIKACPNQPGCQKTFCEDSRPTKNANGDLMTVQLGPGQVRFVHLAAEFLPAVLDGDHARDVRQVRR